ncbi:Hypothetical protein PACV_180 [Pacmanvirus A23]|uniref:Hypothetical protein n=1 Tax=Pacmanvirus A23 TaxID=1932881 RepID=UPI000A091FE2|nr:Hypothetical protein B9W72_gp178 [Pacmanvirus A23]SIP85895.1 Hypothetical protein PACV_180 [Pacmanvirus A23]
MSLKLVRKVVLSPEEERLLLECQEYEAPAYIPRDYEDIQDLADIFMVMRAINAAENPQVYSSVNELVDFVKKNGCDCNRRYFRNFLKGKKLIVGSIPYCSFKFLLQTTKNPQINKLYELYLKLDSRDAYAYE